jgi:hypothetical protein
MKEKLSLNKNRRKRTMTAAEAAQRQQQLANRRYPQYRFDTQQPPGSASDVNVDGADDAVHLTAALMNNDRHRRGDEVYLTRVRRDRETSLPAAVGGAAMSNKNGSPVTTDAGSSKEGGTVLSKGRTNNGSSADAEQTQQPTAVIDPDADATSTADGGESDFMCVQVKYRCTLKKKKKHPVSHLKA